MLNNNTARQLRKQFVLLYNEVDYYTFVKYILKTEPREQDIWQEEKWNNFKQLCDSVLRTPEEHLEHILHYTTRR